MTSVASEETIYCFKCRRHTDTRDEEKVVLKNRRWARRGRCVECGTKKFRMLGVSPD